jgi:NTE family protein
MVNNDLIASLELFRTLTGEQRNVIQKLMKCRNIARGDLLVLEGEPSDSFFVVIHGAFEVCRSDSPIPIAQIRAGEVIGEIGFFAGTPRTATVTAIRDAMVMELDRAAYEQIEREIPSLQATLLSALAQRLGNVSAQLSPQQSPIKARTIALVQGGNEPVPPRFFLELRDSLAKAGVCTVDHENIKKRFKDFNPDSNEVRHWLNALEWEESLVVYFADSDLTEWTRKCIRQADIVLIAVRGQAPANTLTPVEDFVCKVHSEKARRLVIVHDQRSSAVSGTSEWLSRIDVFLHHHLSIEDDHDFKSLVRFLTGRAVGFAGGGGGGFGPAHIGIYKAFREHGVNFDIFIGTSVGAAITAGFAMRLSPERIDEGTHDIFINSRGFKRPTWPRYALLDHKNFDDALARNYGADIQVEDMWHPFFAVTTNLSCQQLELIRTGPVWKAVRASASIPGILPPVFTENGTMLVDGGVMDNAPLAPLKVFKAGPNLVVHFGRQEEQRFDCQYEKIPGRRELVTAILNPFKRRSLPRAPGVASVLMRSMMAHQHYKLSTGPEDLILQPPPFPGASFMSFDQHSKVFHASYEWAMKIIDELQQSGDPALSALIKPD